MKIGAGGGFLGTWFFNVRVNGASQFAGAGRMQINTSQRSVTKSGLDIAVTLDQPITLDLEVKGQFSLPQPISFFVEIEDGLPAEETTLYTTASIADGSTENGTAALGKSYEVHQISADKNCRVRVYLNAASRTADAARPVGTDPDQSTEHGVVTDIVLESPNLSWDLAPVPVGSNRETSRTSSIPIAIENMSGSTGTVAVTFKSLKTEE